MLDIKTQLIRLKPTYISPNPECTVRFTAFFPPEIIPYDKKLKIACVTTTFILKVP